MKPVIATIAVLAAATLTACGSGSKAQDRACKQAWSDSVSWAQGYAGSLPTPQPWLPLAQSAFRAVIASQHINCTVPDH